MKKIQIGNVTLSEHSPVLIIAEVADSHNGSLEQAKALIDAAKEAGADIVKFQLHLPDIEMVPGKVQMWDGDLHKILQRNLFTIDHHRNVMEYCKETGIEYLCTPFCPDAVDVLNELGVTAFKTGSGEITNLPHHRKLAKISAESGKPVLVSTGMCNWEEIAETVSVYEEEGAKQNLVLLNCTSEYPPNDYGRINLGLIPQLAEKFGVYVGQSDHTMDNYTAFASVAQGARVIEKHFTLSRKQRGPDHAISLEPHMLKDLVEGVRKIEKSLGSIKHISADEQVVRDWAFHSIVAKRDIKMGTTLSLEDLVPKRPGEGIPAKYLDKKYAHLILGKEAKTDIPKDTIVQWDMLK